MEKDFHYHCIGVLARAAGFEKGDALVIAYASQYVDDSTESEPIRVGEMMFDPVRTAHVGLRAFDWGIQKRVYIPFHFIPPNPLTPDSITFITEANSKFASMILKEALKERKKLLRLCRTGVALHTFADTWSHQGFSGRENEENDVEAISLWKGGRWKRLILENFYLDLLPKIGHAQAGYFPDQPFLTWKYKNDSTGEVVERHNTDDFIAASKTIYDRLRTAKKSKSAPPIPWESIENDIRTLFEDEEQAVEKRSAKWRLRFEHLFDPLSFEYDRREWRNEALQPGDEADTDWDDLDPSEFRRLRFPMKPGFYDTPWVRFHRAALRQRHFVLENLL